MRVHICILDYYKGVESWLTYVHSQNLADWCYHDAAL